MISLYTLQSIRNLRNCACVISIVIFGIEDEAGGGGLKVWVGAFEAVASTELENWFGSVVVEVGVFVKLVDFAFWTIAMISPMHWIFSDLRISLLSSGKLISVMRFATNILEYSFAYSSSIPASLKKVSHADSSRSSAMIGCTRETTPWM